MPQASAEQRVKFCFLFCAVEGDAPVVDSFCQLYEPVIRERGDAAEIAKTKDRVRKSIDKNEVKYLCVCKQWSDPICARR